MKREFADRAGLTAGDACHPVDPKRVPLGLLLSLLAPITLIPPARVQAAVPPNDSCTGAQVVVSTGPFPYSTIPVDITDATVAGGDPPLSNPDLVGKVAKSVWYRFTPAGNAVYTITSCSDAGTATTVADTILAVYRSSGGCSGPFTQVGMLGDEDCGPNGAQAAVTVTLAADTTYYIVAWKYCDNCTDDGLNVLQLIINGTVAPPNDTCSSAAPILLNSPVSGTTVGAANNYELSGTNGFSGLDQNASPARGRDVVYSFTAPSAGDYSIKVHSYDVNQDLVLYALTNCPGGASPVVVSNCLAAANRSRVNSAEEIVCLPLAQSQRILLVVDDSTADNPGSPFILEVTRCTRESEPNDDPAHASQLSCGIEGSIESPLDVDFYTLGRFPEGWRAFAMVDGEAARNQDLDLRITTSTNTIEYDNDNNDAAFGDSSPNIAGTPLPGEPTFVLVGYNGNLRQAEPYRLYAVVQPPLDQAAVESEPNDDPAQANLDDRNYFYGTLAGPAPSTDVDVYAFSVAEGDLIFLSLDGDPHRTNSPLNARLELLDGSGNPLVSVNDKESNSTTNGPPGFYPSSPGEALTYLSPVEGTFFARVSISPNAAGNDAFGNYLLSISKNCVIGPFGINHAPALTNVAVTPPVTVGIPAHLTGALWEPDTGDTLKLEIRWGDGATNVIAYAEPGWFALDISHTYTTVNASYTLTATARDRMGNVATVTQSVLVRPEPQAARLGPIRKLANGHISLQLQGTPNGFYRIEKADTLGAWNELISLGADAAGRFTVEDPAPSPAFRFYRAIGVK